MRDDRCDSLKERPLRAPSARYAKIPIETLFAGTTLDAKEIQGHPPLPKFLGTTSTSYRFYSWKFVHSNCSKKSLLLIIGIPGESVHYNSFLLLL